MRTRTRTRWARNQTLRDNKMVKRLVLFFALAGASLVGYQWLSDNLNDALGAAIFVLVVIALLMLFDNDD